MAPRLDAEAIVTIKKLSERGCAKAQIARTFGVSEGAVRYHLRRLEAGVGDGRAGKAFKAEAMQEAILSWLQRIGEGPINLTELHRWLVEEHGYTGSARSLQRYWRANFPAPKKRARRRVETPPGAQAQVDWAHFPGIPIAGEQRDVLALHIQLSHSRYDAVVWSFTKDQLAWLHCHNEALRRLGGVPAVLRVDNEKTAISHGAGAWGEINLAYRRYCETVRFHVDACAPRSPWQKGKVERVIRSDRLAADPRRQHWRDLDELQAWSDLRMTTSAKRRICPATGTSVFEAWRAELPFLAPLPELPEPFDTSVRRRVSEDCLVSFEGRRYSVPFALVGQELEVRGVHGRVQILAQCQIVASHERWTTHLLVIDVRHFEGSSTDDVIAPVPLGRMGRKLQELAELAPERRPLDYYAALAEVAR